MGQLPPVFDGDRTKTEGFVDSLRAYFRLNHEVPAFQSYLLRSHSGRKRQMLLVSVSRDSAVRTVKSYSNVP